MSVLDLVGGGGVGAGAGVSANKKIKQNIKTNSCRIANHFFLSSVFILVWFCGPVSKFILIISLHKRTSIPLYVFFFVDFVQILVSLSPINH